MNAAEMPSEMAEQALIGSLLYLPSDFPEVADLLDARMFGVQDHRTIYRAMQEVVARGGTPDVVQVQDALAFSGDDVSLALTAALAAPYTPGQSLAYARRVHHHARRRGVLEVLHDAFSDIHQKPDADPVEVVNALVTRVNEFASIDGDPLLYADVIEQLQQRLTDQHAGLWEDTVLPTGIRALDARLTGGFRPAELIILAGRPGSGKTAAALQVMHNVARRHAPVLMFSAEMSVMSLVERGLSEVSGVEADTLRSRTIDQSAYDRLMRAAESMSRMPVAIDDTSAIKTATMLSRAQRFQRKHGLAMVIFDYMELAGDESREGEQVRISNISHALKAMAKQLEVPVMALSQLSRKVEDRTPPIPRMSDLRMSGAIEQDADKVLFVYRHDYYADQGIVEYDADKAGTADIIIGKQRNGSTGEVTVKFDASRMRFTDFADDPAATYDMRTIFDRPQP